MLSDGVEAGSDEDKLMEHRQRLDGLPGTNQGLGALVEGDAMAKEVEGQDWG